MSPRTDGIRGTQFSIFMPIQAQRDIFSGIDNSRGKLIIVDDQYFFIKVIANNVLNKLNVSTQEIQYFLKQGSKQFKEEGFIFYPLPELELDILFISNGDISLKAAMRFHITAMVTDQNMPGKTNGEQLIQWVQSNCVSSPFLAIHSSDPIELTGVTTISKGDSKALNNFLDICLEYSYKKIEKASLEQIVQNEDGHSCPFVGKGSQVNKISNTLSIKGMEYSEEPSYQFKS